MPHERHVQQRPEELRRAQDLVGDRLPPILQPLRPPALLLLQHVQGALEHVREGLDVRELEVRPIHPLSRSVHHRLFRVCDLGRGLAVRGGFVGRREVFSEFRDEALGAHLFVCAIEVLLFRAVCAPRSSDEP